MAAPSTHVLYGGGPADFVGDGASGQPLIIRGGVQLSVWSTRDTGGAVTDLYDASGDPVTVVTADGFGNFRFFALASFGTVYVSSDGGVTRFAVQRADIGQRVLAAVTEAVQAATAAAVAQLEGIDFAQVQAALADRWTKAQAAVVHAPYDHEHPDLYYTKPQVAALLGGSGGGAGIGFDVDGTPYIIGAPPATPVVPPTPPATDTVTADIRSWLDVWRLQLPTDTDGNGVMDEVRQPALATHRSDWFSETPTRDGFQLYVRGDGFASTNSSYARTELREVVASSGVNAAWSSSAGVHIFTVGQSVDSLTGQKRRLITTQIHNGDDVVTSRFDNNGTGGLMVSFLYGDGATPGQAPVVVDPNYTLGAPFTVRYEVEATQIKCFWNGTLRATFTDLVNNGVNYFKCGAYFLSRPGLTSYTRPDGTVVTIPAEPADISARVTIRSRPTVEHRASVPAPTAGGSGPYTTLNRFKLQLPINSDNAGNVDEITRDQLTAGYSSQWFTPTADAAGFRLRVPVTGARTSGSQFPRTELREVNADGTNAGWHPSDGKTRSFTARYRVLHLPPTDAQTTLFQIHNEDTEVTTFRCDLGRITARKNGSTVATGIASYSYGADVTLGVTVTAAAVTLRVGGAVLITYPFSDLNPGPRNLFYFKAGNYLQANPTTVADPAEYGEVELRDIVTTF